MTDCKSTLAGLFSNNGIWQSIPGENLLLNAFIGSGVASPAASINTTTGEYLQWGAPAFNQDGLSAAGWCYFISIDGKGVAEAKVYPYVTTYDQQSKLWTINITTEELTYDPSKCCLTFSQGSSPMTNADVLSISIGKFQKVNGFHRSIEPSLCQPNRTYDQFSLEEKVKAFNDANSTYDFVPGLYNPALACGNPLRSLVGVWGPCLPNSVGLASTDSGITTCFQTSLGANQYLQFGCPAYTNSGTVAVGYLWNIQVSSAENSVFFGAYSAYLDHGRWKVSIQVYDPSISQEYSNRTFDYIPSACSFTLISTNTTTQATSTQYQRVYHQPYAPPNILILTAPDGTKAYSSLPSPNHSCKADFLQKVVEDPSLFLQEYETYGTVLNCADQCRTGERAQVMEKQISSENEKALQQCGTATSGCGKLDSIVGLWKESCSVGVNFDYEFVGMNTNTQYYIPMNNFHKTVCSEVTGTEECAGGVEGGVINEYYLFGQPAYTADGNSASGYFYEVTLSPLKVLTTYYSAYAAFYDTQSNKWTIRAINLEDDRVFYWKYCPGSNCVQYRQLIYEDSKFQTGASAGTWRKSSNGLVVHPSTQRISTLPMLLSPPDYTLLVSDLAETLVEELKDYSNTALDVLCKFGPTPDTC